MERANAEHGRDPGAPRGAGVPTERVHLLLSGSVHGIGLRWSAREKARELGLTGKAENLTDGRVEIIVEGPTDALQKFRAWCYHGPKSRYITAIDARTEPADGTFPDFSVG